MTYKPSASTIEVSTYDSTNGWVLRGTALTGVSFAAGNVFGARVRSNGTVEVYKGTTLLGTRDASAWSFINQTGTIGLRVNNGPAFLLDDFGGGTVAGGSQPTGPLAVDGGPQTASDAQAHQQAAQADPQVAQVRLTEVQALVARVDAWQVEYQRVLGAVPARPAGCKPLCDLLTGPGAAPARQYTETPRSGEVWRMNYFVGGAPVAVRTWVAGGSNTIAYLHADHLGSVSLSTAGSSASIVSQTWFDPWGQERDSQAVAPTQLGYTGQYREANAWVGSLMNYRARYYAPVLGRFISPDTIVPDPGNPQALNRYSYAFNNPINHTDPSGHVPEPLCAGYMIADCGVDGWYGPTPLYNAELLERERKANEAATLKWIGDMFGGLVNLASIFAEPIDYAVTASDCFNGNCSPLAIGAALIPFVPGAAGRAADQLKLLDLSSPLARQLIDALADASTRGERVLGGVTVLGGHPEYVEEGMRSGNTYLNMDDDVWNTLAGTAFVNAINQRFLDESIAAGHSFQIVLGPNKLPGRGLQMEIQYLLERGYVQQGDFMVPGP